MGDRFGLDEMRALLGSMGFDASGDTTQACLRCCKPHLEHTPCGGEYFGLCSACCGEVIGAGDTDSRYIEQRIRGDMATRKWAVTT